MTHPPSPTLQLLARLALALALAATLSCAQLGLTPRSEQVACWPLFPYEEGWLGADGAYSLPLSRTQSLWLFGDTFVGVPGQADRAGARFIHNSVAMSDCDSGGFSIRYFWGRNADGSARAFFHREGRGWWWPFGAFRHADRLYVGLLEVERARPSGPLGVNFRLSGTSLARIETRGDDPTAWRIEVLPLSKGPDAFPLSALVVNASHLYLFAFLGEMEGDQLPRILTRLPLASLEGASANPGAALETLAADGRWLPGLRAEDARILMDDDATEMTVHFHASLGRWLALYSFPELSGDFPATRPSDAVWARTAEALEGPWSERRLVFRVPELAEGPPLTGDPNTGCYGAKEQPQFARPGSLTFTYVCNLFSGASQQPLAILERLLREMDLYRPVAATVTLPGELEEEIAP
ncbi:MAG: DUF4185 domain-containing protein [Myxococcota bacterium]